MKNFLKPTRVTWWVFGVLIAVSAVSYITSPYAGYFSELFIPLYYLPLFLIFSLTFIGEIFGNYETIIWSLFFRTGDEWFALNGFGILFFIVTDLLVLYVVASIVSWFLYKFKNKKLINK